MIRKTYILGAVALLGLGSCNEFLDELPDNRTEVDTPQKVQQILVNAYPENSFFYLAELSSDNIDDIGTHNPNSDRFPEEVFLWKDTKESDNESAESVWEASYKAIAHANEALAAIERMGSPAGLNPAKGEALIARAYNHFILVNMFSPHYNKATADTDLGIPYMLTSEKTLNPQYDRGTVAQVYALIKKDLEEGLPLIKDGFYTQPKFHFTHQAAHALAARFYLFYGEYNKAIEAANKVLGADPRSVLRDWAALQTLNKSNPEIVGRAYTKDDVRANLLVSTPISSLGVYFGPYSANARFSHSRRLAGETLAGETRGVSKPAGGNLNYEPAVYSAADMDQAYLYKYYYAFEMTDIVAQTGYRHAIIVPFTTDETLMVRAEAYALLGDSTAALADLNTWVSNFYNGAQPLSLAKIDDFYNAIPFSTPDMPTQKKEFHPLHDVSAAHPNLLQAIIDYRRTLTLHEGLRWFDIRRYGIEVPHYQYQLDESLKVVDVLKKDDLRRTIQIPDKVLVAGMKPNPR